MVEHRWIRKLVFAFSVAMVLAVIELVTTSQYLSNMFYETATMKHSSEVQTEQNTPKADVSTTSSLRISTNQNEMTRHDDSNKRLVMDILSAGSNSRPEYLQAQKETFGQHRSVRYFVGVTEDDDLTEPNCLSNLTVDDAKAIQSYCRISEANPDGEPKSILNRLRLNYRPWKRMSMAEYPQGWLCAQRRPGDNLHRLLKLYQSGGHESTPDYLMLMDDDTHVDVTAVTSYLSKFYNADEPLIMAGCLQQRDDHPFSTPWGGWGTILSRGAIHNLWKPINCTSAKRDDFVDNACHRLEQDLFDEKRYFRQGMTVADLFYAYISTNRFADYKSWSDETGSYCIHASWVWGYFFNYYNIGSHTGNPFSQSVTETRITSYRLSVQCRPKDTERCQAMAGQCVCSLENCTADESHICHYIEPGQMSNLTAVHRLKYPDSFVSQPMVVASNFSEGWKAVWTKKNQPDEEASIPDPRQESKTGTAVVDVFVYPSSNKPIEDEYIHFVLDGVERSQRTRLTNETKANIWIVDFHQAGQNCAQFVQTLEQAKAEKLVAGSLDEWKVAFLYWDEEAMDEFLECYRATRVIDSTRVYRFKHSIVTGRRWNETVQFVEPGRLVSYDNWREHSAAPVGHINFGVRSEVVDVLPLLMGKATAEEIVTHKRPIDLVHFWPPESHETKNATSQLRDAVSKALRESFAQFPALNITVGPKVEARNTTNDQAEEENLTQLLDSNIVVLTQEDLWEGNAGLMDALSLGAMVMTDPMLTLPDGLKEGESIVVYRSLDDLVTKVQYYLDAHQERRRIALEGYKIAMGMHRSWHIAERIVSGMLKE